MIIEHLFTIAGRERRVSMERRKQNTWEKERGWEKPRGIKSPMAPPFSQSAPVSEKPKQPEVTTGPGPREDFSVGTSISKPPAYAGVTKPGEPGTKESILKKYGVEPDLAPKSRSSAPLTTGGRKPAVTPYAAKQGELQTTALPYAAGLQTKLELPKQSYQRGIPYEKKKISPYDLLPTPQGRDEKEELRMETRQRTQLAKGTSAGELARREAMNRERTYRPTAADLDIQHELLLNDLERVEQLIGQASIAQESAPSPEADRQMERLRQWKNSLLDQKDEIAGQYYFTENEEKRAALAGDQDAQTLFQSVEEVREDMGKLGAVTAGNDGSAQAQRDRAYLMEKYGLTERELERQAPELVKELQSRWDTLTAELKEAGYDYDRMLDYDQMLVDAQRYQVRQENLRRFAQEHPVMASAVSVGMAPFQGAEFVGQALGSWGHSDTGELGSYEPMNPYNMNITNTVNTLRGTVAEEIEKNTDWELFGQNVASFLYQTGMSIGDSALQVGTLGRAATLFMGGSAAASQAQSVMERGGSNRQALWGGLAAGAAEMLFEYVSIDNLLKPKTVTGWKSFLKEAAKQAGVEGSEELFTEVANILSDAAIMRGKSEVNLRKTAYEAAGLSRREAEKRTFLDCVNQAVWAAAGGVISGGVMGSVTDGVSWAGNTQRSQTGRKVDAQREYASRDLSKDGSVYSYDFLTSLPDMMVTALPPLSDVKINDRVDQKRAVELGLENA